MLQKPFALSSAKIRSRRGKALSNVDRSWFRSRSSFDFTVLRSGRTDCRRESAFPLHELYIAAVILALIVAGLYFVIGAWGPVLLWGLGLLFLLPLAGTVAVLFMEAAEKRRKGERAGAVGILLAALLAAALWLAAVGYVGHRAWLAIP
jgi:hypothetical protein